MEPLAGTNAISTGTYDIRSEKIGSNSYKNIKAQEDDSFVKSTSETENTDKIGFFRLAFKRLTQEQIDTINKTGRLPENAKFVANTAEGTSGYRIENKILGLTTGTRTLPAGYEVRKDILGFTRVLPVDSEGLFIKK